MNDPENNRNLKPNARKTPFAPIVWMVILLAFATLLVFRFHPDLGTHAEWTPAEFERNMQDGLITSVNIMPESDSILLLEGQYVNKQSVPGEADLSEAQGTPNTFTTRIYATDKLVDELQNSKSIKVTFLQRDNWWKGVIANLIVGLLILGIIYFLFARQIRGAGKGAMQFGKSRARMILPDEHRKTFDDVAGCDEAKEETKEIVDYLKDPLKFKMLGGRIPHGALLTGPPGTGKTLLAKAVAGEASVPFFSISGSDFVEMFVGVGASRVRDMFDQARKHAPCLIFIDEIDAVGRSRFSGIGGGHDEREQTLNAMLVEMDGLETQEGVIVLAATNRADVLDPALLRPGRFDRQIVIDLPDIAGRRKILDVHVKNIKLDPSVDLDVIAKSTPGFSGADLANLVNEAALLAARNNRKAATQADMEEARDKVCFGRERRSRKIPERERRLTAWHEAGHAIVNLYCKYGIPLHKVTIIPRGQALGMTMMMENEDRYSRSRLEMLDSIATDMGGRVAEEIAFGDISSGAAADISHATNLAHAMVCSFGMSEKLGTVKYGERSEHIYVGRDITKNESCSEETLREIDNEVKRIVMEAKERACRILTEHRDQLDKLANALLEQETISAAEIRRMLDLPDPDEKESGSSATEKSSSEADRNQTSGGTEPETAGEGSTSSAGAEQTVQKDNGTVDQQS